MQTGKPDKTTRKGRLKYKFTKSFNFPAIVVETVESIAILCTYLLTTKLSFFELDVDIN